MKNYIFVSKGEVFSEPAPPNCLCYTPRYQNRLVAGLGCGDSPAAAFKDMLRNLPYNSCPNIGDVLAYEISADGFWEFRMPGSERGGGT